MSLGTEVDATIVLPVATLAVLVELGFDSGTERIWGGFGPLVTSDAKRWSGVGELTDLSGLSPSLSGSAPAGKIGVSGATADAIAKASTATEYKDKIVTVYLQAFQGRALYGNPVPISSRIMKTLGITRDADTRKIAVGHEGPYTGRRRPPAAWYTHSDQDKRHSGDTFCDLVTRYRWKRDTFPVYA